MTDDQQRARELMPCPFCGSADSEMQQAQAEHYVQCLECEASTSLLGSRHEARELWNRRAALRAAPEGFVMVPVEMDLEMEVAFCEAWFSKRRCIDDADMQDAWAAALAARPQGVKDA